MEVGNNGLIFHTKNKWLERGAAHLLLGLSLGPEPGSVINQVGDDGGGDFDAAGGACRQKSAREEVGNVLQLQQGVNLVV